MPIYVDADACPVKEEVYRVARRYGIKVYVVANAPLRVPAEDLIGHAAVRAATDAILDYLDADFADEDAAFKALGRIFDEQQQ